MKTGVTFIKMKHCFLSVRVTCRVHVASVGVRQEGQEVAGVVPHMLGCF